MHWTALLVHSRIPPEAPVIDDLSCAGCGYNLRGLRAGGSCPECAAAVRQSLAALQAPDAVGSSVRGLGRSVMGLAFVLPVAGFRWGLPGVGWFGVGLLLVMALLRLITALELRTRGRLRHLAFVARRLDLLCAFVLLDLGVTAAGAAVLYFWRLSPGIGAPVPAAVAAWGISTLIWLLAAASMGSALAHLLGYDTVEREFRVGRGALTIGLIPAGFAALALAALASTGQTGSVRVLGPTALVLLCAAAVVGAGFVAVGMLHLAAAAERERDERRDVLGVSG